MTLTKKIIAATMGLCLAAANLTMLPAGAPVSAEGVSYDVNADGAFDIMDVISLTKYLHLKGTLANYDAADIDRDGSVDIFDLTYMMRALVGMEIKPETTDPPETTEPADPNTHVKNLSAGYEGGDVEGIGISDETILGQTQFAIDLINHTAKTGENVLVSPYSVSQALGMTANGAKGTTREEMENVLGANLSALNPAMYFMRTKAPNDEDCKLSTANSIWFKGGYPVSSEFLQTNATYYGADAYEAPFDDTTLLALNNWVDEHTDHMIPKILEEFPEDSVMVLVNAVAFDAKWWDPYTEDMIRKETFTKTNGAQQEVEMMYSSDRLPLLKDEHAVGFKKYYSGSDYYFAALLPEEGMTPESYLDQLTADGLHEMLTAENEVRVTYHGIPAFSYDFGTSLADPLKTMGMPTAFERYADFTGMVDEPVDPLCIGDVIHKTHIEVNAAGTRAGAATAVIMTECATEADPTENYTVILDRPFVYMIVDANTDLPIFLGTVNSVETPEQVY